METAARAGELIRRFAAAVRVRLIYPEAHPIARRSFDAMHGEFEEAFRRTPQVTIGFLGDDVIIGRTRLRGSAAAQSLVRRFRELQVDKISLSRDMGRDDLQAVVGLVAERSDRPFAERLAASGIRGVGAGWIDPDPTDVSLAPGLGAARQTYRAAVAAAEQLWSAAKGGEEPDPDAARLIIDTLARAVTQDRTSMMALTALKSHDAYTFTHMVNVSLLTMAQARTLGLSSQLVREFGLAGLMHDVGKTRIPIEILGKPGKLTPEERVIMQRHVIDGAQILRKTPGLPALAPIVAFEHHLRQDLSGYPANIGHRTLNLCTMLVSIADVFDALRSNRAYREGLPANRVRHMLDEQAGTAFEPTLLRRFITLMGIFPVGTFVRLTSGEVGVVAEEHATDPLRPRVTLVLDRFDTPFVERVTVDTSARTDRGEYRYSVLEAVDGATLGVDPIAAMSS